VCEGEDEEGSVCEGNRDNKMDNRNMDKRKKRGMGQKLYTLVLESGMERSERQTSG